MDQSELTPAMKEWLQHLDTAHKAEMETVSKEPDLNVRAMLYEAHSQCDRNDDHAWPTVTLKRWEKLGGSWNDKAGAAASLICAIHCVTLPLLIALLPTLGIAWLDNSWFDMSFLLAAVVFIVLSHPKGYKQHKRCVPILQAIAGVALITPALFFFEGSTAHHYFVAAGGLLIAGSHWLNHHYLHKGNCCELNADHPAYETKTIHD